VNEEAMQPGIYPDIPEAEYHADPCETPSLSCSVAQALILESAAHAYLRHPKLGGEPFTPTADMDRGTLIHALMLGKGISRIEVVECDDWTKKSHQEIRKAAREAGLVPVTRKQYEDAGTAAIRLTEKLKSKGFLLNGHSEVSLFWRERTRSGVEIECRGRMDHLVEHHGYDLKITNDANPKTLTRGHMTNMGYDIQGAAYTSGLANALPQMRGRTDFTFLFCEPVKPYCVTPVVCSGSLRILGERKWQRAIDSWERCLRLNEWDDYTNSVVYAEARPWELDEYGLSAD
jgi:hypothetical protein